MKGKCSLCGDIIESTDVHHMVWCECGHSFIDGGDEYLRGTITTIPLEETDWLETPEKVERP
jgi:hypothetical protein